MSSQEHSLLEMIQTAQLKAVQELGMGLKISTPPALGANNLTYEEPQMVGRWTMSMCCSQSFYSHELTLNADGSFIDIDQNATLGSPAIQSIYLGSWRIDGRLLILEPAGKDPFSFDLDSFSHASAAPYRWKRS